jgi:DNA polymerase-3 subunit gamma/tau
VTVGQVRDAWPQVLQAVQKARMSAWMVLQSAQVQELRDGPVLVLSFPSRRDVQALKDAGSAGHGVGDYLKDALAGVLGIRPALVAKTDASAAPASPEHPGGRAPAGDPAHAGPAVSWEVVPIPTPGAVETEGTRVGTSAAAAGAGARGTSPDTETPASGGPAAAGGRTPVEDDPAEEPIAEEPIDDEPEDEEPEDEAIVEESTDGPAGGDEEPLGAAEPAAVSDGVQPRFTPLAAAPSRPSPDRRQRYGEAVVREVLGARFIGEQSLEAGE